MSINRRKMRIFRRTPTPIPTEHPPDMPEPEVASGPEITPAPLPECSTSQAPAPPHPSRSRRGGIFRVVDWFRRLFDNHNETKRHGASHGESQESAKFERELDTIPEESETEDEPPVKPSEHSKTVYYNIPAVVINDATI